MKFVLTDITWDQSENEDHSEKMLPVSTDVEILDEEFDKVMENHDKTLSWVDNDELTDLIWGRVLSRYGTEVESCVMELIGLNRFVNLTPHQVDVYAEEDVEYVTEIRKWVRKEDATPIMSIPSSGMASVGYTARESGQTIRTPNGHMIKIWDQWPSNLGNVEFDPDAYTIVSLQYALALKETNTPRRNVITIKDTVFDNKGRPVGCLGFYTAGA